MNRLGTLDRWTPAQGQCRSFLQPRGTKQKRAAPFRRDALRTPVRYGGTLPVCLSVRQLRNVRQLAVFAVHAPSVTPRTHSSTFLEQSEGLSNRIERYVRCMRHRGKLNVGRFSVRNGRARRGRQRGVGGITKVVRRPFLMMAAYSPSFWPVASRVAVMVTRPGCTFAYPASPSAFVDVAAGSGMEPLK